MIAQCGWVGGAVEDNSEKTSDMLHQNDETPLHDCFRPSEKSQLMVQWLARPLHWKSWLVRDCLHCLHPPGNPDPLFGNQSPSLAIIIIPAFPIPSLSSHKKQIVPAFLEGGRAVRRWVVSGRSSCTVQPAAFSRESVHFVLLFAFLLFVHFVYFVLFCLLFRWDALVKVVQYRWIFRGLAPLPVLLV